MTRAAFSMKEITKAVWDCYSDLSQISTVLNCIANEAIKNGNTTVTYETVFAKGGVEQKLYTRGCSKAPRVSGEGITIQDIIWGMYEANTTSTKTLDVLRTLDYNQSKIIE